MVASIAQEEMGDAPRIGAAQAASVAFAAIVAFAHQTSSSRAVFVVGNRFASMSVDGLLTEHGVHRHEIAAADMHRGVSRHRMQLHGDGSQMFDGARRAGAPYRRR